MHSLRKVSLNGYWPFRRSFFTFIFVVQFAYFHVASPTEESKFCESPVCKETENQLSESIDTSVEPCDDIYQYVCGKWVKSHSYNQTNGKWQTTRADVRGIQRKRVEGIMKEKSKADDIEELKFARELYQTCLNGTALNAQGLTTLNRLIKAVGEWPLLYPEDSRPINTTWQDINKKIDLYFTSKSLYWTQLYANSDVPAKISIHLLEPETFLPSRSREEKEKPDPLKLRLYYLFIERVAEELAKSMNIEVNKDKWMKDIKSIVQFETEILKIIGTWLESHIDLQPVSILSVQKWYDAVSGGDTVKIDWLDVLQNKYRSSRTSIGHATHISIVGWNYFLSLGQLLKNTPPRTIVLYTVWHFIRRLLPYTTEKMQNYVRQAELAVQGVDKTPEDICLEMPNLLYAVDYEYVKRYFSEEQKQKVLQIFYDLQTASDENVREATWMDCSAKTDFREEVKSLVPRAGSPDWYSNEGMHDFYQAFSRTSVHAIMSDYFLRLNESTTTLLDDVLRVIEFDNLQQQKRYGKVYNAADWVFTFYQYVLEVDSTNKKFYKGSLRMPAGMFYDALFHPDKPEAMNYGSLGYRIGYRMAHGYGTLNKLFSQRDNVTNAKSAVEQLHYNNLETCVQSYYDAHLAVAAPDKFGPLDRSISIQQFIEDAAAVSSIWRAWENHKRSMEYYTDVRLQGFSKHTSDQLLFISLVYDNCENIVRESNHLRLSSSLANLPAFSKAFGCSEGLRMNPAVKCKI